jgi:hypothetical protein
MNMVRIPQRLQELLREVMAKYRPEMVSRLLPTGELSLAPEQREPLRNSLASELCENGLLPNDEPNERGYALEELIDLVGKA